ncbi:uncharacterized protein LOC122379374 [Amphibalanus amphitrite]|uniref:uncharacterized protein LOC122379374 n=1 Tax=Amphibalanus amphitrite TaxID=1232801 RepID=UPI001C912710|nr:uncharacterized protein LOC122379374 [Amphibalanus amphitrite]XP_043217467.1 uncharacterized protein LOC122379374 [Amphibalanus amphitrite]XP_043217468.1 uncharacterized protein LOC122379374 [Amphibalanus amphitrite]
MEEVAWCTSLLCLFLCLGVSAVCAESASAADGYMTVDLEESRAMCRGSSLTSNRVWIQPERPVLLRLGHLPNHDPARVEQCELRISAPADYGISITINSMNLDFRRNQFTGSISCRDHVRFSRPWDSFMAKALAKVSDVFSDRSDSICRQNYEVDINRPELYNVGKTANIFHSTKNEVGFEYERGSDRSSDKEFTIVATAFRKTNGSCPDEFIRCGIKSVSYCISERLRCDGFVNCGFPGSGVDEEGCSVASGTMSTHTFVWVTLVLALAVFICCLISCALRCWVPSQSPAHPRLRLWFAPPSRSPADSRPTSSSGPVPAERTHLSPLPSYESVVGQLGGMQSPPAYKDLFPERPVTPPGADLLPLRPLLKASDRPRTPPAAPPPAVRRV